VIKFSTKADEELTVWAKLFPLVKGKAGQQPRKQTLLGKDALILPYIPPLKQEDLLDPNIQQAARKTFQQMADLGLVHEDLKLSNMGLYRKSTTVVLFDFGKVAHATSAEAFKTMDNWLIKAAACVS